MNLLPRPLLLLARLRFKGAARRLGRSLKTVKGAVMGLLGGLIMTSWLLPMAMMAFSEPKPRPDLILTYGPLGLLATSLINLLAAGPGRGIAFTAAETAILFPAPLTRRQLLTYRVGINLAGMAAGSVFFSLLVLAFTPTWLGAALGLFVTFAFTHLFDLTCVLTAQTLATPGYALGRRLAVAALVLAVGVGVWWSIPTEAAYADVVPAFRQSVAGKVLLAPFVAFAHTMAAPTAAAALLWAGVSLAINAAMLALVLWLDAEYLEASLVTSAKAEAARSNVRKGNIWGNRATTLKNLRLPMFPRLGGGGPVAWQQTASLLRGSRVLLIALGIFAAGVVPMLFFLEADEAATPLVSVVVAMSVFLLPTMLTFDFRSDVGRLDYLRSLPVPSWRMCLGQVLVPTTLCSVFHWLLLAGVALTVEAPAVLLLGGVAFLPLVNWIAFAVENTFFLWFPGAMHNAGAGDIASLGRQSLLMLAKMLIYAATAGVAAALALLVRWLAGDVPLLVFGVAWLVVLAASATLVPLLVSAYDRVDTSAQLAEG